MTIMLPCDWPRRTPVVRESVCSRTLTELFRSLISRTLDEVRLTRST